MIRKSRSLHARPEAAGVTRRGWDKEHLSQAHLQWPTFFSQVLYFVKHPPAKASTLGHVCMLHIKLQQGFHWLSHILVSPKSWDTALKPRGVLCYCFNDFFLSMISSYEILSSFFSGVGTQSQSLLSFCNYLRRLFFCIQFLFLSTFPLLFIGYFCPTFGIFVLYFNASIIFLVYHIVFLNHDFFCCFSLFF